MRRSLSKLLFYRFSHTKELTEELYLQKYFETIKNYYHIEYKDQVKGYATQEGTNAYSQMRSETDVNPENFKVHYKNGLKVSTLGIGTYLGAPTIEDDAKLFGAILDSIQSGGVNHIDTAINYRYQKSERTVGAALRFLFNNKAVSRDQIFVSSKNGYIPGDGDRSIHEEQLIQELVEKNIIKDEDVVANCHCMTPAFLEHQLNQSLKNLGLETLDLMYLHNAAESQQPLVKDFDDRLAKAFEFYEKKVQEGKIRHYGMATWVCFRSKQEENGVYLDLQKVNEIAEKVAGKDHHFNYTQVPINIMMPEVLTQDWQNFLNEKGEVEKTLFLRVARLLEINVISSSPLMSGTMMQLPLSSQIFLCQNLGAKHLQFVRSIPSDALKCTLVGMKRNRHVKTNLEVIKHRPLTPDEFWTSMEPQTRKQFPEEELEVD